MGGRAGGGARIRGGGRGRRQSRVGTPNTGTYSRGAHRSCIILGSTTNPGKENVRSAFGKGVPIKMTHVLLEYGSNVLSFSHVLSEVAKNKLNKKK